jgi:uncharacterized membrane protein
MVPTSVMEKDGRAATLADPGRAGQRLALIDLLRGGAILAMVTYHFAWDLFYLGYSGIDVMSEPGWIGFQRLILGSFLVLAGASLVLGHGNGLRVRAFLRRLAVLAGAAALVTLGTYLAFPDYFVFFGVLHAIALFSVMALPLLRAPLWLVIAVALVLLALPALITLTEFTDKRLAWIGFWPEPPMTTDIVPVFPWLGVLLAGMAGMRLLLLTPAGPRLLGWHGGRAFGWLAWTGRHSLVLYLVHQPLLLGGLMLLSQLLPPDALPETAGAPERFLGSCTASCTAAGSDAAACEAYCGCALDHIAQQDLWAALDGDDAAAHQEAVDSVQRICTVP